MGTLLYIIGVARVQRLGAKPKGFGDGSLQWGPGEMLQWGVHTKPHKLRN